jgi:hypothetical protein
LCLELHVPIKHGHHQSAHTTVLMVSLNHSPLNVTVLIMCSSKRIECYRLDSLRCKPTDVWLWFERQSVSKHALDFYYGRRECYGSTSSTNSSACVQLFKPHQCKQPSVWYRIDGRSRFGRRTSTGLLSAHGSLGPKEGETKICSSAHLRTAHGTYGSSWKLPQAVVLHALQVWDDDNHCVSFNICAFTT